MTIQDLIDLTQENKAIESTIDCSLEISQVHDLGKDVVFEGFLLLNNVSKTHAHWIPKVIFTLTKDSASKRSY